MATGTNRVGKVQTVLGLVEASGLGLTLPHEHLLWDPVGKATSPGNSASEISKWDEDIRLDNYSDVRRNYRFYKRPQQLVSIDDAIQEVGRFRDVGGSCIVDATPAGVGRDPLGLLAISRATGVHVVMGSGYYVDSFHSDQVRAASENEVATWIAKDLLVGAEDSGVKAGLIGEIGLSWPVQPDEEKVLRGAVIAQRETGAALMVHPGRDSKAPLAASTFVTDAGGDVSRLIICHMERTIFSLGDFLELADTGCYLEFDLFGIESSFYPWSPIDMPNDATRIEYIRGLIERGHCQQILMSHDIDMKVRLQKYGGEGYGHIFRDVIPLMRRKEFSDGDIRTLLIENPAAAMQYK